MGDPAPGEDPCCGCWVRSACAQVHAVVTAGWTDIQAAGGPTGLVSKPSTGLGHRKPSTQPSSTLDLPVALSKFLLLYGPQFSRLRNGFNKTSFTDCLEDRMGSEVRKFVINWEVLHRGEE